MLVDRFVPLLAALALAGASAKAGTVPVTAGTLRTDTPLFVGLLGGVIVIIGALTFFPALALGPIVEDLFEREVVLMSTPDQPHRHRTTRPSTGAVQGAPAVRPADREAGARRQPS